MQQLNGLVAVDDFLEETFYSGLIGIIRRVSQHFKDHGNGFFEDLERREPLL